MSPCRHLGLWVELSPGLGCGPEATGKEGGEGGLAATSACFSRNTWLSSSRGNIFASTRTYLDGTGACQALDHSTE